MPLGIDALYTLHRELLDHSQLFDGQWRETWFLRLSDLYDDITEANDYDDGISDDRADELADDINELMREIKLDYLRWTVIKLLLAKIHAGHYAVDQTEILANRLENIMNEEVPHEDVDELIENQNLLYG